MQKTNEIKLLSEILATALAGRPDLNRRLSTMLGARPKAGKPGKEKRELTHKERKQMVREMFNKDFTIQKLKSVA